MNDNALQFEAQVASKEQIKQTVDLLLSGVSSDPKGMAEFASSWWKRTIFKYSAGPRVMGRQMDTFVVSQSGGVLGYLSVQYGGDSAGAFEWGVSRPITQDARTDGAQILRALVRTALDHVEEQETFTHFYIGMMSTETDAAMILEEEGFYPADYQLSQMVGRLPLRKDEGASTPAGLSFSPKVARTYRSDMDRLLRLDYPGDDEDAQDARDTAAALHLTVVGNPRLVQIDMENEAGESEAVGFLQINRYKDQQRVLYSLAPHLWGTETEVGILRTVLAPPLVRTGRLRLRTFSWDHMHASRPALEAAFGLSWEESLWRRYVVAWEE